MKGRLGIPAALAVVFVLMAVPMAAVSADTSAGDVYESQLDENGKAVYDEIGRLFGNYSNKAQMNVLFEHIVLFDAESEAKAYAQDVAYDAMSAMYYADPTMVHLWNLPVEKPAVKVATAEVTVSAESGEDRYYIATSVEFELSVPKDMEDDPTTTQNELRDRMDELKGVLKDTEFSGAVQYMVRDVAHFLKKVKVTEDEEGTVSNIYDALVGKSSSTAGIAAAFTAICAYNGIDAITVKGDFYQGGSDKPEDRFWNQILLDGVWYAGDVVEYNKKDTSGFMMAGSSSEVSGGNYVSAFSVTHAVDLDLSEENGLVAPELSRDGFPYPDETPAIIKYGPYVILGLIGVILVATVYHAMKHGNI